MLETLTEITLLNGPDCCEHCHSSSAHKDHIFIDKMFVSNYIVYCF